MTTPTSSSTVMLIIVRGRRRWGRRGEDDHT